MKRTTRERLMGLWLAIVIIPATIQMVGCGAVNSTASYRVSTTVYRGAVEIMTDAAGAGLIDLETAEAFELRRAQARVLLDLWGDLEAEDRGEDFIQLQNLERLLDLMIQAQEEIGHGLSGNTGAHPGGGPTGGPGDQGGQGRGGRAAAVTLRTGPDPRGPGRHRHRLAGEAGRAQGRATARG